MRAESSVTLSLHWDPRKPVEAADLPAVRSFLVAVKGLMQLPAGGLRLVGPLSVLEAAFEALVPETTEPRPTLAAQEIALIREALAACGGKRSVAARQLGIPVRTLHRKMKRVGLRELAPVSEDFEVSREATSK